MSFDDELGSFDEDFLSKLSDTDEEKLFALYDEKKDGIDEGDYRREIRNEIEIPAGRGRRHGLRVRFHGAVGGTASEERGRATG